jgi:ribonuclease inhibitor
MSKISVEINGQNIESELDFHREIARSLGFPSWYGNNLDALWDMLTGHIDTNVIMTWKNHNLSRVRLGSDFDKILSVFEDLKNHEPDFELILN